MQPLAALQGHACSAEVSQAAAERIVSAVLALEGVFTNLAEYPAVPVNSARFCFQVMSSHTPAARIGRDRAKNKRMDFIRIFNIPK